MIHFRFPRSHQLYEKAVPLKQYYNSAPSLFSLAMRRPASLPTTVSLDYYLLFYVAAAVVVVAVYRTPERKIV